MKNLFLKIACMVVAVLVWILVAGTTMVEADVGLPLQVVGLADGLTIAGNTVPDISRVRIRAPKLSVMAHNFFGVSLGSVDLTLRGWEPGPAGCDAADHRYGRVDNWMLLLRAVISQRN